MLNTLERIVSFLTRFTAQGAKIALFFTMAIIVGDVILRIPWKPLPGTFELVEMGGAVLLALGVAYTAMLKGHIAVGVLVERFPSRIQALVDILINAVSLFFIALLAREIYYYASRMMEQGLQTALGLPIAPSIYLVAFGMLMLALTLFVDLLKAFSTLVNKEDFKGSVTG